MMGSFEQAVDNVLAGKAAISGAFSGQSVPFTKDEGARKALAEACEQLGRDIRDSFNLDYDADMTALIVKLAAYCTKQGWNTEEAVAQGLDQDIPVIAEILRAQPDILNGKAGIAGILKKHHQDAVKAETARREEIINDKNAPPLFIFSAGSHELYELLNPAHLKAESAALNHCVGRAHNVTMLSERKLKATDEGADECLSYAVKIRSKQSRIFSLRTPGGRSYVTLEYDTGKKRIHEMKCLEGKVRDDPRYFADLCDAIYQLKAKLDLSNGINGLPDLKENMILTREGMVPYSPEAVIDDILAGKVAVRPEMSAEEMARIASCPNMVLDLSAVSNDRLNEILPETVSATLESGSPEKIELKHLIQAGDIEFSAAPDVHLPVLEKAKDIYLHEALNLQAPALVEAEAVFADNLVCLNLPSLKKVHYIASDCAQIASLPALERAQDIYLKTASSVDIPEDVCKFLVAPRWQSVQNAVPEPYLGPGLAP